MRHFIMYPIQQDWELWQVPLEREAGKSSLYSGGPDAQQKFLHYGKKGRADIGQQPAVSGTATNCY